MRYIEKLKPKIFLIVVVVLVVTIFLSVFVRPYIHNGFSFAAPDFSLANTKWVYTVGDAQLHLSFNSAGTILMSEERGYEFIKYDTEWRKIAFSDNIDWGWPKVESGYCFIFEKQGDTLTIIKETEFSGIVLEQWHCIKETRKAGDGVY